MIENYNLIVCSKVMYKFFKCICFEGNLKNKGNLGLMSSGEFFFFGGMYELR